ncbi:2-phospho-L-lactate transferase [Chloroflexota bacterium]
MNVVALAGGVGGAKLADGLAQVLSPADLTIIVNTGDDFDHFGLRICPDLDTVCYTLAGMANPETGWGRISETMKAMDVIEELGGPTWFKLGDHDLGLHLERTRRLQSGNTLSEITAHVCQAFNIDTSVLPMSDQFVPTWVHTHDNILPFQEYFVHRSCEPEITGFHFEGVENANPAPGVLESLRRSDFVVFCPSNPWVSINPILAIPGIKSAISSKAVIAISPIIGGRTLKGPAAKMYLELGIEPSAVSVARHYGDLLKGFIFDETDKSQNEIIGKMGLYSLVTDTIMRSEEDRVRLAEQTISFGNQICASENLENKKYPKQN